MSADALDALTGVLVDVGAALVVLALLGRVLLAVAWRLSEAVNRAAGLPEPAVATPRRVSAPVVEHVAPIARGVAAAAALVAAPVVPPLQRLAVGDPGALALLVAAAAPELELDERLEQVVAGNGWLAVRDAAANGDHVRRLLIGPPGLFVVEPVELWTLDDLERLAELAAAVADLAGIERSEVTPVLAVAGSTDAPRWWSTHESSNAIAVGTRALPEWLLALPHRVEGPLLARLDAAARGCAPSSEGGSPVPPHGG